MASRTWHAGLGLDTEGLGSWPRPSVVYSASSCPAGAKRFGWPGSGQV